ncbi:hypothetical protein [Xanthomonas hortorum]|uniref:Uncharacterized protein n=1 Tax=Xanthomonas hortorum pv. hederae TaxID=453603 RepID=A0A9X4BWA1_9XANT|nr:hypothetical protein [Xanthomonas hortorum]MCE4373772.1 hypothetical protein [Xanthomonas hortorum pv. hederae]MDC8640740.1 hypothetical protein [Xanthomonas hortorum pv. hederae]
MRFHARAYAADATCRGPSTTIQHNTSRRSVADLPLSSFIGSDGLITFLSFLDDKLFSEESEVLELIKRLHVPNYEAARHHFEAAIANGVFEPRSAPSYYDQEEMHAVLNWVQEQQEQA